MEIRELTEFKPREAAQIDVAEQGMKRYQMVEGQLQLIEQSWQRPTWDQAAWRDRLVKWAEKLKPDLYLGAYREDRMVGLAGLRHQLQPTMAQLTSLYIDNHHRRQGVAQRLVQEVFRLSRAHGAECIYVSSTPSVPAVAFYMRQGFQPTEKPDPTLFALEPADIHMLKRF